MKKILLSLMLAILLLVPFGGTAVAEDSSVYIPGGVPAQTELQEVMLPPIHALVLAMVENELDYDADSEVFVWSGLYYMLSLYGQMDERALLTDDALLLPSETVRDYAAPLFPALSELPEIPDALSDRLAYSPSDDMYVLALGDMGQAAVTLEGERPASNGGRALDGALIYQETDDIICRFTVRLSPADSMFGYVVSGLKLA